MTTTFETAKIGDKVYSTTFGWGEIERIGTGNNHPINVRFAHDNSVSSFTVEGYYRADLPRQSLFWGEVSIEAPPKPVPTRMINGIEIPDISFTPCEGELCCVPSPIIPQMYIRVYFNTAAADEHRILHGLCYPDTEQGKQAAIMHAKAMLGIHPHQLGD
jgi:hypothetical protein